MQKKKNPNPNPNLNFSHESTSKIITTLCAVIAFCRSQDAALCGRSWNYVHKSQLCYIIPPVSGPSFKQLYHNHDFNIIFLGPCLCFLASTSPVACYSSTYFRFQTGKEYHPLHYSWAYVLALTTQLSTTNLLNNVWSVVKHGTQLSEMCWYSTFHHWGNYWEVLWLHSNLSNRVTTFMHSLVPTTTEPPPIYIRSWQEYTAKHSTWLVLAAVCRVMHWLPDDTLIIMLRTI